MTNFNYLALNQTNKASGVVIVIDVLRAFTTAAHAFEAGAEKIYPVAGVREALKMRKKFPGSLIMGEVDGEMPAGFDFGNSPDQFRDWDLLGRNMIQRTSAGTQGVVNVKQADQLFAASFVVAKATAMHVLALDPSEVSFIVTGESMGRDGDEDRACGEYIQALIEGRMPNPDVFTKRVSLSAAGIAFRSEENWPIFGVDLEMSTQVDRFPFSMPIIRKGKFRVMTRCNL